MRFFHLPVLIILTSCVATGEKPVEVRPSEPAVSSSESVKAITLTDSDPTYTLMTFENESFRDFTREEYAARMGANAPLMGEYVCDGVKENDFFWSPLRTNALQNSLRVKAYGSNELYTYHQGIFRDSAGNVVEEFDDVMLKAVQAALRRFETIRPTSTLLRYLEESYFPLTIRFGGNSFNPMEEGGRNYAGIYMAQALMNFARGRMADDALVFNNIGVGGVINWHPRLKLSTVEADGQSRELDPDVALAHEMYHAFDSIRGLLDFRFVKSDMHEFQMVSEYRAVRFENLVRRELGLLNRMYYSPPKTPGDPAMLDQDGETYILPSPCMSEL